MRVVLDTNVLISALVFGRKPLTVLDHGIRGDYELIISESILRELNEKLAVKFGWPGSSVALAMGLIRRNATIVSPNQVVVDCADPDDNRILEAAAERQADYIVSGDKHLLRMRAFRGIPILTVSEFLRRPGSSAAKG